MYSYNSIVKRLQSRLTNRGSLFFFYINLWMRGVFPFCTPRSLSLGTHRSDPSGLLYWRTVMAERRADRTPGHRGAFEKARQVILATQDTCGICGKPVDKTLKYPHPMSPTVDHIIPVSKGGHPSDLANLQLAHRCCNRQKSDKLIERKDIAQGSRPLSNRLLPLHCDWLGYGSSKK